MDDAIVKKSMYSLEVEVFVHIFACHFAGPRHLGLSLYRII
jgi:hypothetical protein